LAQGCTFRSAQWGLTSSASIGVVRFQHSCQGAMPKYRERMWVERDRHRGRLRDLHRRSVLCGANVTITDTDLGTGWIHVRDKLRECGRALPVRIRGRCVAWRMNVTVLKGVTIGAGTAVAANSTVTKSLPPGVGSRQAWHSRREWSEAPTRVYLAEKAG